METQPALQPVNEVLTIAEVEQLLAQADTLASTGQEDPVVNASLAGFAKDIQMNRSVEGGQSWGGVEIPPTVTITYNHVETNEDGSTSRRPISQDLAQRVLKFKEVDKPKDDESKPKELERPKGLSEAFWSGLSDEDKQKAIDVAIQMRTQGSMDNGTQQKKQKTVEPKKSKNWGKKWQPNTTRSFAQMQEVVGTPSKEVSRALLIEELTDLGIDPSTVDLDSYKGFHDINADRKSPESTRAQRNARPLGKTAISKMVEVADGILENLKKTRGSGRRFIEAHGVVPERLARRSTAAIRAGVLAVAAGVPPSSRIDLLLHKAAVATAEWEDRLDDRTASKAQPQRGKKSTKQSGKHRTSKNKKM